MSAEVLDQIAREIADVQAQIAPLEARLDRLRIGARLAVEDLGGKAEAAGLAFMLTEEGLRTSYDTKAIDGLVVSLTAQGNPLAQEIAALRRSSVVKPTLRISKVKV